MADQIKPIDNEDKQTLRMLFQLHHQQLWEKRQHIHHFTERVVGLLVIIFGWLLISVKPHGLLLWAIVAGVIAIGIVACIILYRTNRGYSEIAAVVRRLNEALALYDGGRYMPGEPLYPKRWRSFGRSGTLATVWHHLTIVILMTVLCIIAALACHKT